MAELSRAEKWSLVRGTNLQPEDRHCLLTLFLFQGDNESAFCRQEVLADEIGVHPRSVRRSLQRLNEAGAVVSTWQAVNGIPIRVYAINFDGLRSIQRGNGRTPASYPEPADGRTPVSASVGHQRPIHQDTSVLHERSNERSKQRSKGGRDSKTASSGQAYPDNLRTAEFQSAWQQWVVHRREIRKTLTPTTTAQQLAKLSAWGPQKAIRAIHQSIEHGWQGLFDPDDRKGGTASGTDATAAEQAWQTLRQTLRSIDRTQPYKAKLRQTLGDRVFNAAETVGWSELFDLNQFTERKLFALFSAAIGKGA